MTSPQFSDVRAAIFDLDGTLLDTEPLYTQATQTIAARYGKRFEWELKRQTMGGDAESGARLVIRTLELPLSLEEYMSTRVLLLKELFKNAPAMAGAQAWLECLHQAQLPLAIGTSSFIELCEIKWAHHPWLSSIPIKVCGDDPQVSARKPAPDIFLQAAERLGVPAAQCIVFEDSPAGIEAARRAGMRVIVIRAPELARQYVAHADLVVDGYHELTPNLFWA